MVKPPVPAGKPDVPETDYDSALSAWFAQPSPRPEEEDPFARGGRGPASAEAIDRVRAWTRERFKLSDDVVILVSELECRLPGCPPLETVIAFWENETRHHFKLFKPVAKVAFDDLPFTWMKSELIVPDDFSCECC